MDWNASWRRRFCLLDRHYIWRSHDPMYVRHFVHLILRINHFPFALIWSFSFLRLFFYSRLFSRHHFFQLFYGATRMEPDRLSSCASCSDNQISLNYSMAVFRMNSFGLFRIYYLYEYTFTIIFPFLQDSASVYVF